MREIQANEAETRLGELLQEVEGGEVITITREGKAVARLSPVIAPPTRAERKAAIARFRKRRANWERVDISTEEILAFRHEGHRF